MQYVIGFVMAIGIGVMATTSGLDREKAFYTTVLIVVGSYYALFAAMGATGPVIAAEAALGGVFLVLALIGFKRNFWIVVVGLVAHGVFDFFFHHLLVENPGMPRWWPGFCGTYDVVAGAWLAARLTMSPQAPLKPERA